MTRGHRWLTPRTYTLESVFQPLERKSGSKCLMCKIQRLRLVSQIQIRKPKVVKQIRIAATKLLSNLQPLNSQVWLLLLKVIDPADHANDGIFRGEMLRPQHETLDRYRQPARTFRLGFLPQPHQRHQRTMMIGKSPQRVLDLTGRSAVSQPLHLGREVVFLHNRKSGGIDAIVVGAIVRCQGPTREWQFGSGDGTR